MKGTGGCIGFDMGGGGRVLEVCGVRGVFVVGLLGLTTGLVFMRGRASCMLDFLDFVGHERYRRRAVPQGSVPVVVRTESCTALDDGVTAFRSPAPGRASVGVQTDYTSKSWSLFDDENFNGSRMYFKCKLKPAHRMCTDVDSPDDTNLRSAPDRPYPPPRFNLNRDQAPPPLS